MRKTALLLTLASCVSIPSGALATVYYRLQPVPESESINVSITLDAPKEKEEFRIPAWCPGFYFLQDYQRKISDVRATDQDGSEISVVKGANPRSWTVQRGTAKRITLTYRVLGDDPGLGFFGVNVRSDKAFVNGPAAFMYAEGRKSEDTKLALALPEGWDVATGMGKDSKGTWSAGDYDELIDHPLQLGKFTRRTFKIGDIPFEVAFVSPDNVIRCDVDKETERIRRVSIPTIAMFGGAPFKKYSVLIHLAVGNFSGGLEHRASNVMAIPNVSQLGIDELASHEFIHAWNVKQIRPKVLGPFDYTREVRTDNLWFSEGVTDYYSKMHTLYSGLKDEAWLYSALTSEVRTLQSSQARRSLTLAQTSQRAWENGGFGVEDLSYYNKGLVCGLILDAAIRSASSGQRSLDDVMRMLYAKHRLPNPGFEEDALLIAINEVSGTDLTELYRRLVYTPSEVPYEMLADLGLRVLAPNQAYATLAVRIDGGKVVGNASGSGLLVGDLIEEAALIPNGKAKITYIRQGERGEAVINVRVQTSATWRLEADPFATLDATRRRSEWLDPKTNRKSTGTGEGDGLLAKAGIR